MAGGDPHPPRPPQEDVEKPLVDVSSSTLIGSITIDLSSAVSSHISNASTQQGRSSVFFSQSEKDSLIKGFKHLLVVKFSHGRPALEAIKKFFINQNLKGDIKVSYFDSKHIVVECGQFADFVQIWIKKVWFIHGFSARIFKWDELFHPSIESSTSPIWIHLPCLPIYFYSEWALLKIASVIGRPLFVDKNNINRKKLGYATICVEIDVAKPLIDRIWIQLVGKGFNGSHDGFWQQVVYDYIPDHCSFCLHLGHKVEVCKRLVEGSKKQGWGKGIVSNPTLPPACTSGTGPEQVDDGSLELKKGPQAKLQLTQVLEEGLDLQLVGCDSQLGGPTNRDSSIEDIPLNSLEEGELIEEIEQVDKEVRNSTLLDNTLEVKADSDELRNCLSVMGKHEKGMVQLEQMLARKELNYSILQHTSEMDNGAETGLAAGVTAAETSAEGVQPADKNSALFVGMFPAAAAGFESASEVVHVEQVEQQVEDFLLQAESAAVTAAVPAEGATQPAAANLLEGMYSAGAGNAGQTVNSHVAGDTGPGLAIATDHSIVQESNMVDAAGKVVDVQKVPVGVSVSTWQAVAAGAGAAEDSDAGMGADVQSDQNLLISEAPEGLNCCSPSMVEMEFREAAETLIIPVCEQVLGKTSGGVLECRNSHTASKTPRKLSGAAAEFTPKWDVLVEELVEGKKQSENEPGEESLQQVYDRIKKMNRGKIGSKKGNLIRPTIPHRAKDETDSQNMDNTFVAKANTSKGSKSNGFIDYELMMTILRRPSRRDRDNPSLKRTSTCDTNVLTDFILPLEVDSEPSSPASRNSHFMDE